MEYNLREGEWVCDYCGEVQTEHDGVYDNEYDPRDVILCYSCSTRALDEGFTG